MQEVEGKWTKETMEVTVLCGKGRGRTQGMFGETQDYHLRIGSKDGKPSCSPRRYMYTGASSHLAGAWQGAGRSGRGMGSSAAASAGRRRWRGSGASSSHTRFGPIFACV